MLESLFISLQLALATTGILLLLALPLAYALAFKSFRGRTALEVLVALPLVLPPTVLGYFVLVMIAPDTGSKPPPPLVSQPHKKRNYKGTKTSEEL